MAIHLAAADHPQIGPEEPRTDDTGRLNCPRCIRTVHTQNGAIMMASPLAAAFTVTADQPDRVVLTLNREQAAKLAEVLGTCVDDSVIRLDWDEPESADLVQDLNGRILNALDAV
jgi:hypothetical protein